MDRPGEFLPGLANGIRPGQLERQEGHDPLTGDPLSLVGLVRPEQDEGPATGRPIGRGRDLHAQRHVRRPCAGTG